MKINDEGTSNAAHWHERAMKAEARLAAAEALLSLARNNGIDGGMGRRIDAFLEGRQLDDHEQDRRGK